MKKFVLKDSRIAQWQALAQREGLSFAEWLRRACEAQASRSHSQAPSR